MTVSYMFLFALCARYDFITLYLLKLYLSTYGHAY